MSAYPENWELLSAEQQNAFFADEARKYRAAQPNGKDAGKREDQGPVDLKDEKLTQRDALLRVCDKATVWRSPDGEPHVSVPASGHIEHHPISSRAFRNWMLYELASNFTQNGRPCSAGDSAVRDARAAIEARAMIDGQMHQAVMRTVEHEGVIYIDLGTAD
jgi:putative DNA primase/helicase